MMKKDKQKKLNKGDGDKEGGLKEEGGGEGEKEEEE